MPKSMRTPEQAKKVPIKYIGFSQETINFLRKNLFFIGLACVPLALFYPNLTVIIEIFLLVLGVYIYPYASRPLFESFKKRAKKDKSVLPFLYIGEDEYKMSIEIPAVAMRQHMLLLGSTGSGKTSLLRRMIDTQLKAGGGCCFIDGKADVGDMYQIFFSEVVEADREEDFYLINFMDTKQSHTFNPFLYGDSDFISEIMSGLLKEAQGDQVYWQERGIELMRALLTVLVWKRDNQGFMLNISSILEHLNFEAMVKLGLDESIPEIDERTGKVIRRRMMTYLNSLSPNWMKPVGEKGGMSMEEYAEVIRQYGYGVQQWSATLDLLRGTYGLIFNTDTPDIDIRDVVLNNKILYVLLPSLKQSPQTLNQLGRFIMSVFKIVFTELIGDKVIGDAEEIYSETKAKKPDPPYLLIMDEAGSYLPDDIDTVLAQARSTGVSVVISVQEIASLFKINEAKAKRLLNNTKIKISLAVDDPDTAKYFVERAGEEWTFVPSVRREVGDVFEQVGNFDGGLSYQKMSRIEHIDLYALKPGHGYIIYLDEIRKFYSPELKAKRPKKMRLLRFVKDISNVTKEYVYNIFPSYYILGHEINKWDEEEKEWLAEANMKWHFTPLIDEEDNSLYIEEYVNFVNEIRNEMNEDEEYLSMGQPDMEVWNEFKQMIFNI